MEMVGMMGGGGLREQAVALLNDAKLQTDISAKTDLLKRLKEILVHRDPSLLREFVPYLMELQTERASPIRKCLAELIEEIGTKHLEHVPVMVPVLLALLQDDTPAVARSAITSGTNLFRNIFEQVAMQGIQTGHVERWLEDSWMSMIRLKDAIYSCAYQHSNDGVRFHAIKFVETTILLFTPDPNSSSQPPSHQQDIDVRGFNVAWIVGGHPVLDAAALGEEASRNLGCLLDQLRPPDVSKLPGTVAIVLVNSLAAIAKKRPSMYGRVLPVLLNLGPTCETIKGPQAASIIHTLRNAFLAFLKCTHPVAGPWRERLLSALRAMNAGDVAESAFRQVEKTRRNAEKDRASRDNHLIKDDRAHGTASGLETIRKRPSPQENGNQISDLDENTSKRVRDNFPATQPVTSIGQDANRSGETSSVGIVSDTELSPLQQMIAMIGALVAKGERAAASIELLITSLPADMLADIVIENMRNLPVAPPPIPVVGATTEGPGVTVETNCAPSSTLATTSVAPVCTAVETSSVQTASDHRRDLRSRDPRRVDPRKTAIPVGISQTQVGIPITPPKNDELTAEVPLNNLLPSTVVKNEGLIVLSHKEASLEHEQSTYIPGVHELSSTEVKVEEVSDTVMVAMNTSTLATTGTTPIEGSADNSPPTQSVGTILPGVSAASLVVLDNQAVVSSISSMLVEVSATSLPALSVKLEPVSGVTISTPPFSRDNHLPYLSMGSFSASGIPSHGLPATVPVMQLNEEQQDALYKDALMRILEGCNPIAASGGAELRIALLARMIAQSHEDDEILGTLQKYILADYQSHKGHELAIHILYQLYCDKMADVDTNETCIEDGYEKFLLSVAQGLRDNLPPSDKSLSRLLGEVPLLPEASLKFLELLCIPATGEKDSLDRSTGDRVTQGLSSVWSLILFRPPIRAACLNIALQCAVHELEEVRTKAIRLVANKLYPLEYASQTVEDFATRMLQSVIEARQNLDGTRESAEADTGYQEQTTEKESEKQKPSISDQNGAEGLGSAFRSVAEEDQRQSSRNTISATEAIRYMSLFFALCVKKNSLLRHLFAVFGRAPKGVKQAVKWQMPTLIRTIGPSSVELLQIISDPPSGSKNLVLQVLHILTESTAPPVELINAVKQLHEKSKDAAVLIPVLSSLSKDEVLPIFPPLVDLSPDNFKAALARILQGSVNTGPALSPAEVLIAIHGIDAERDGVPLSKVKDACSICFQQRTVFTQQVLAKVLNQLVEQTPLPMLFMRTVIQAVGAFHSLVNFVMEILSRLVSKQIWKSPTLWVGFLKCADQTQPHSFHVLLQLPAAQLEKALHKHPNLRSPLTAHASQPNIRSTLPRSTLVVLGLAQDAPIDSVVPSQLGGDGSGPPSVPNDTVATESAPTV